MEKVKRYSLNKNFERFIIEGNISEENLEGLKKQGIKITRHRNIQYAYISKHLLEKKL